jgi:choline dehydrogenase-like flavoprotein
VRGVSNLRVVDASVMPTIVSANTNAATYAIAERGAAIIRKPGLKTPVLKEVDVGAAGSTSRGVHVEVPSETAGK